MIEKKNGFTGFNLVLGRNLFHFDIKEFTDGNRPVGKSSERRLDLNIGLDNTDKTHPVEHSDDLEQVDDLLNSPEHFGNKINLYFLLALYKYQKIIRLVMTNSDVLTSLRSFSNNIIRTN